MNKQDVITQLIQSADQMEKLAHNLETQSTVITSLETELTEAQNRIVELEKIAAEAEEKLTKVAAEGKHRTFTMGELGKAQNATGNPLLDFLLS